MFLTTDYNRRKDRKNVEDMIHDMLPIRKNVIKCIELAITPSRMILCVCVCVCVCVFVCVCVCWFFFVLLRMLIFGHVINYMSPAKGG